MRIRPASFSDITSIASLHISTVSELETVAYGMGFNAPRTPTPAEAQALFTERITEEEGLLLIAVGDEGLLGYLSAVVEPYEDDLLDTPYMTIEFVMTAPAARRQGIAAALIAEAEREAANRGVTNIDLMVWASNTTAAKLYKKLGYNVIVHRMAKKVL
jgi:ribosomal protein S18 acetylase RimI-like enzyme